MSEKKSNKFSWIWIIVIILIVFLMYKCSHSGNFDLNNIIGGMGGPPPPGGAGGGPGIGVYSQSANRDLSSPESNSSSSSMLQRRKTASTEAQPTEAALPTSNIEEVDQTYNKIMAEAGKKTSEVMSRLSAVEEAATYGRKLTVNNTLSVQVDDVEKSKEKVRAIITDKGYIGASEYKIDNLGNTSASITLRVKTDSYDSVREALIKLGQVVNETESIQDISDEYFDLQSYINTRQLYLTRLQKILADQKSLDNIISLTEMVTNVQGEINRSKGQLNQYDDQVKFSTINLMLLQPTKIKTIKSNIIQIQKSANPKFLWTHKEAIDEGVYVFQERVNAIINWIIYQLTGNLFYWLLFIIILLVARYHIRKHRINIFELHHHHKFPDKEE